MKKNNLTSILLTVILASSFIIFGAYAINYMKEEKKNAPEQTVKEFFSSWINYEGNPLSTRYYATLPQVSTNYSEKVDKIIESFEGNSFDPILCAQDFPEEIKFINTTVEKNNAVVTIEKIFSGNSRTAEIYLERQNGKWLIIDIICETEQNINESINVNASPVVQQQVGAYIRNNINELSPQKAVLGGTFYVTSINFSGPNTCNVNYEDGHIDFSAKVRFNVPAAGEVEIISFELEESALSYFNKTGNITKSGENWNLVYEEPGKPALTRMLEFTDNSKCLDQYENKACWPVYWNVGDRVEIEGEYDSDKIIVSKFSVIGESSREINSETRADGLPVTNFDECIAAGYEKMEPDCIGCKNYCDTEDGRRFEEENGSNTDLLCEDLCGDGICQEIVCMGEGCPCAETITSCPEDCAI